MASPPKAMVIQYQTIELLLQCYMPFTKNGGLFLPTPNKSADLPPGTKIMLMVALPGDTSKRPCTGEIVWSSPPSPTRGVAEGIGLSFDDNAANKKLKVDIENLLAGKKILKSHTM